MRKGLASQNCDIPEIAQIRVCINALICLLLLHRGSLASAETCHAASVAAGGNLTLA
jgi:hypothetical protein